MSAFTRNRDIPIAVTFLLAVLSIFGFFFKVNEVDSAVAGLANWATLVTAFAICFGILASGMSHIKQVRTRTKGTWLFHLWLLIVMAVFVVTGITLSGSHPIYQSLYTLFIATTEIGMWAIAGAAAVTAGVRCFRVKKPETLLLLVPAVVGMLMTTPFWDNFWGGFVTIGDWMTNVPVTAANRGFIIAAAVGALTVAFRTIIGREIGYLGKE